MDFSEWDHYLHKAVSITGNWLVWKIEDATEVIRQLARNNLVILGGDVLNNAMEYTNDNWYYTPNLSIERSQNVKNSAAKAREYLTWFMHSYGKEFFVLIVVDQDTPLLP